jgi:hypothetical protein
MAAHTDPQLNQLEADLDDLPLDSREFERDHLSMLAPAGWTLNPSEFSRIKSWNMLMFQLALAKQTITSLIARKSNLGSLSDFSGQYALYCSFVLAYAKCFTSVGADQKKLDSNDVYKDVKHLRPAHDEILVIRHKLFAHNDNSKYVRVDLAVLESKAMYQLRHSVSMSLPIANFPGWLQLVEYVESYAIVKINKALDALEIQLGKPIRKNDVN